MPTSLPAQHQPRYGCQECRDDAELVLGGRANNEVTQLYTEHLRGCSHCQRFDRRLRAVYRGPCPPPSADQATLDREFAAILAQRENVRAIDTRERWGSRAAIVGLTATAAALALALMSPGLAESGPRTLDGLAQRSVAGAERGDAQGVHAPDARADMEDSGGIGHRAQAYGRVVAGDVRTRSIDPEAGSETGSLEALTVGTEFEAVGPDSVQLALVGKMLVSLDPGTRVRWDEASSERVSLRLDRGLVAVRYDRKPADPVLHIVTPTAIVRVMGTVFTVEVTEARETVVSVLRGQVEVLDPVSHALTAEVVAGDRFDLASMTYADVGPREVNTAIPVSNEFDFETGQFVLADGLVPASWTVPGLPDLAEARDPERMLALAGQQETHAARAADDISTRSLRRRSPRGKSAAADEEEDLMEMLVTEVKRTRAHEVQRDLERCRALYASAETRFRAASCLTRFTRRYGDEPGAAEGYLMIGILRMDFAQDHQSASRYFQTFLARAPEHELAELAYYRLWLASTERGVVSEALDHGRRYLARYPHGRYVSRIHERFPELAPEKK